MRTRAAVAVLPLTLWSLVSARLHHSLVPEDPHAFPKFRVAFLNGLPLLNETAHRWIQGGLQGGELEFLDQPWEEEARWRSPPLKSIDGGDQDQEPVPSQSQSDSTPSYRLELMKMGPRASYLCLIPPPPADNTSVAADDSTTDMTPVHSWSLLQPLSGGCLYHKQGWFTYAYCHNSHVRQFHELVRPGQQRLGQYKPEEDTEWEAYTLGRAPPTPEPGADLTVAQEAAIAANVELARNAGSRYLVQRWADGTYCEKIGRKREIEIQFHCSMTMTDSILFVKETQTCHYVLHIATPRLCGEPGFRSRVDSRQEAYIRCREIVSPEEYDTIDRDLPEREYPVKIKKQSGKPVIAPPPADDPFTEAAAAAAAATAEKTPIPSSSSSSAPDAAALADKLRQDLNAKQNELVRKALEMLLSGTGDLTADGELVVEDEDGEVVISFIDLVEGDGGARGAGPDQETFFEEVLRTAGYELKERQQQQEAAAGPSEEEKRWEERRAHAQRRDEL